MKKKQRTYHDISCEFEAKTYSARYYVEGGIVTVSCEYGSKSAVPGASGAEFIARLLIRELVQDAKRQGSL